MEKEIFVDVVLRSGGVWTYGLGKGMEVGLGDLVVVPFRRGAERGVVVGISEVRPEFGVRKVREVLGVGIGERGVELAKKISEFYGARLGKCVGLFLPRLVWDGWDERGEEMVEFLRRDFMPRKGAEQQKLAVEILGRRRENCPWTVLRDAGVPRSTLKALEEKEVVRIYFRKGELSWVGGKKNAGKKFELTEEQAAAVERVCVGGGGKFLLFGETGTGKSLVYREVAERVWEGGKGVIVLVPEISLTPQVLGFFREKFGGEVAVWHSGLTERERARIWQAVWEGKIRMVVGSRSALFLPVRDLGLVVVDEEHVGSYKQDREPRYDARGVAEMMCDLWGVKVLVGSATPRVESFFRTRKVRDKVNKFELLELKKRLPGGAGLPEVEVVDMRRERGGELVSGRLEREMCEILEGGGQVILFLNRRGLDGGFFCGECGEGVMCKDCDVRLVHHGRGTGGVMMCHLCGRVEGVPRVCPKCGSVDLRSAGGGTEKLVREVGAKFGKVKIARLDGDSVSGHEGFRQVYEDFLEGRVDVLVGTQMVAQGLDFPGVGLVGVVDADVGLGRPDFRGGERLFALLKQVGGRAGRRGVRGRVVVQTFRPGSELVELVRRGDYVEFFRREVVKRREHGFPPFRRVVKLTVVDKDGVKAERRAQRVANELKRELKSDGEVFCAPAVVGRRGGEFYWQVVVLVRDAGQVLKLVREEWGVRVDVDPVEM